ncbi:hypothetical protein ACW7EJ_19735, partial [Acinetobacter soli]
MFRVIDDPRTFPWHTLSLPLLISSEKRDTSASPLRQRLAISSWNKPSRSAGFELTPGALAELIRLIGDGTISSKIAKRVFTAMMEEGAEPKAYVEANGL